jgi:beta-RFAP synthase
MIRVRAPSRLHFGLLSLPTVDRWPNFRGQEVLPARRFGSVGLMVQEPGVQLAARPAATWSADGPLAERALAYARRFAESLPTGAAQPLRLTVERASPEHVGLGTGTQLAMAVGRASAVAFGLPHFNAVELAKRLGRGARSGIGVHGFALGGFLVDAGKRATEEVAPVAARLPFPLSWRVLLIVPPWGSGLHGPKEEDAFQRLQSQRIPLATTDALCRLVLLGMLPALAESDWAAFGEAVYDFNVRVGEVFASVQGGSYGHRQSAELVAALRAQNVPGVGQSSWGPSVFAITQDPDQALDVIRKIRKQFGLEADDVISTPSCNDGASVELLPE